MTSEFNTQARVADPGGVGGGIPYARWGDGIEDETDRAGRQPFRVVRRTGFGATADVAVEPGRKCGNTPGRPDDVRILDI